METKMDNKELLELKVVEQVRLRELIEIILDLGADEAIRKWTDTPEFEEEACEYCREMGWREPR